MPANVFRLALLISELALKCPLCKFPARRFSPCHLLLCLLLVLMLIVFSFVPLWLKRLNFEADIRRWRRTRQRLNPNQLRACFGILTNILQA